MHCKNQDVVPASLNITCPIRTEKGRNIIKKARKALLNERISLTSNRIKRLRNDIVAKD